SLISSAGVFPEEPPEDARKPRRHGGQEPPDPGAADQLQVFFELGVGLAPVVVALVGRRAVGEVVGPAGVSPLAGRASATGATPHLTTESELMSSSASAYSVPCSSSHLPSSCCLSSMALITLVRMRPEYHGAREGAGSYRP